MLQSRYYTIKKPIVIILLSMFGRKAEPSMIPGRRGSWSERLTNWVAVTLAVELKGNEESALLVVLHDWNWKRMRLSTLCATHEKTRSESDWLRGVWVVPTSCMPCKRSNELRYTPHWMIRVPSAAAETDGINGWFVCILPRGLQTKPVEALPRIRTILRRQGSGFMNMPCTYRSFTALT